MKMAAVKLTSEFIEYLFQRDAPNEWRPPYQCEAGVEKTATFLRAGNFRFPNQEELDEERKLYPKILAAREAMELA